MIKFSHVENSETRERTKKNENLGQVKIENFAFLKGIVSRNFEQCTECMGAVGLSGVGGECCMGAENIWQPNSLNYSRIDKKITTGGAER